MTTHTGAPHTSLTPSFPSQTQASPQMQSFFLLIILRSGKNRVKFLNPTVEHRNKSCGGWLWHFQMRRNKFITFHLTSGFHVELCHVDLSFSGSTLWFIYSPSLCSASQKHQIQLLVMCHYSGFIQSNVQSVPPMTEIPPREI